MAKKWVPKAGDRPVAEKVGRVAFLYLEPKPRDDRGTFAQCWSCRMFVPSMGRCIIHGSKVEIDADDSCGFYVDWPTPNGEPNPEVQEDHAEELRKGIPGSVTPEESGLVDERVQCHRCVHATHEATICGLYVSLNAASSKVKFDTKIKPNACCNAWTEKPGETNGKEMDQESD